MTKMKSARAGRAGRPEIIFLHHEICKFLTSPLPPPLSLRKVSIILLRNTFSVLELNCFLHSLTTGLIPFNCREVFEMFVNGRKEILPVCRLFLREWSFEARAWFKTVTSEAIGTPLDSSLLIPFLFTGISGHSYTNQMTSKGWINHKDSSLDLQLQKPHNNQWNGRPVAEANLPFPIRIENPFWFTDGRHSLQTKKGLWSYLQ